MRLAVEILIFLMQIMVLGALFYRLRHTGQPWSIISPFLVLILLMVPVQGIELVELVSHPDTWNLLPTWHDLYIFLASLLLLLALTGVSPLTRRLWESDGHLAESSRQLVTVLESISDGISLVGPDMKLRACNTSAQKILGLPNRLTRLGTPGEAIFRYNAERGEYGPGDVDLLVQERMERSLQFVPHQFERTRPDGTVIEVTGKPVPGGGFITTYRDVTAQRQAERALRDNQRLLQQILDTLPSPINLKDKDLRFLVANQAVIHDSGMSREALIGMRLSETHILSKQAAEELEQTDAAVLRTGERMELPIVPRTLSSGKQVVEQVIKVPFRNEREEVVGVVTVVMDITQRYQAEEELRRSQSLLSQIMETLPSPISLKDSELRLQMVNKAVSDTRGRSKEDLIGMRLSETDLHSKNISLELEATDREVLRTGERREIPSVIRTLHDGRQVVDHLIKVPFRDENGNPVGVLTVGQDVTARVAAEQALQRQQRWLSQILDKLPMPISLKDTAGRFVMINETYARVTNRRKEALLGKRIEDIEYLSEQETNPIDQGDRQVLATGKRVEIFPHHMKRHDGKDQVVHIIKVPFLDEQNTITGVLTVVLDVTHRYKAEQEVRRQEHLLTQVMDTLPSPLSLKDREGHYQMVNQAILELTGQSRAEVLGKTVDQIPFRSADQIELLKAKDQQVLSTGARQELFAQRTNPDGGGLVIEHMIKVPFRDERGKIIGVLTMAQDVTARVQAEEELRQSRNMLTQIMDTMPSPLSLKDRHGHYLMVNQVIAAATGKSKEELVGADMNILQLRPQEEIKRLKEMDDQVLESGTRQERQSLRYDRINGHTIIEQVTKVPFRDARGSIIGVLTMAQDITDR
ncbi:MAG: PAS domain-containing protein, partial [Deltaproteobacteria bacterium]|nr:PAS domain-containing protein [Deltaproteobacteria bacterium]